MIRAKHVTINHYAGASSTRKPVHETFELKVPETNEILHRFRPIENLYAEGTTKFQKDGDQMFRDKDGKLYSYTEVRNKVNELKRYNIECFLIPTQNYIDTDQDFETREEQVLSLINQLAITVKHQAKGLDKNIKNGTRMRKNLDKLYSLLDEYEGDRKSV